MGGCGMMSRHDGSGMQSCAGDHLQQHLCLHGRAACRRRVQHCNRRGRTDVRSLLAGFNHWKQCQAFCQALHAAKTVSHEPATCHPQPHTAVRHVRQQRQAWSRLLPCTA